MNLGTTVRIIGNTKNVNPFHHYALGEICVVIGHDKGGWYELASIEDGMPQEVLFIDTMEVG